MERSIAIDVEGSNESATEDPSVGGSGEEELGTPEVSAAARRARMLTTERLVASGRTVTTT